MVAFVPLSGDQRLQAYALIPGQDGRLHGLRAGPGAPDAETPALAGAVVRHGEQPQAAAARSWREQGIPVSVAGPLGVGSAVVGGVHVLSLAFAARPGAAGQAVNGGAPGELLVPVPVPAVDRPLGPALPAEPLTAPVHPDAPPHARVVQRTGAYAVVVRDGELLLTRLTGSGQWTLPGGGIDPGEHPEQALRRELHEETGLDLAGCTLAEISGHHFTGRGPTGVVEDFHAVRIVYRARVAPGGPPRVVEVGGSSDAAAWVPLTELDRFPFTELVRRSVARAR